MGEQIVSGKSAQAINVKLYQIDSDVSINSDHQTRCNIDKILSRLDRIEVG